MLRPRIPPILAALALALAHAAAAASLTPPNLVSASSLSGQGLLLVWPYASNGPLEAMSWSTFTGQVSGALAGSFLTPGHNLSDLGNPTIARTNLGLGSAATQNTGASGAVVPLLTGANAWSAEQTFSPPTSSAASINLPPGTAPTSPVNGDLWCTAASCYFQANGVTQNMKGVASTSGSIAPTLAFATPGTSSFTYNAQNGSYTCTNGVVTGYAFVNFTPALGTAANELFWTNPPYQPKDSNHLSLQGRAIPGGNWTSLSTTTPYFPWMWSVNAIAFMTVSGTTENFLLASNLTSGSSATLQFSFSYETSTGTC